ncbi:MAG: hypothetical protein V7713_00070 [Marinobacter sp.]|uniref:hypothetical protein n=1 Tax=Marinobacter sp. AC-23 TaxID=1879031 RepID=UPI00111336D6|nr:hypothetical protein [Marinobacter sp. AC-23]
MSTKQPQRKISKEGLWKKMDANTTLLESSAFRWTVRVFGYSALLYAAVVILNYDSGDLEPLSPAHLHSVVANLKNPALIAGISLPILGLIASHLRSLQTKKQIETQQDQNVFSNYLAHRDQFNKFMDEENPLTNVSSISKWEMYGRLFSTSEKGNFKVSSTLVRFFETLPKRLDILRKKIESTTYNEQTNWIEVEDLFDDLEWDFRDYTQAVFSDDLDRELFLSKLEKRIDKHIVCVNSLHECSNFHSAQLEENSLWAIQEKYVQCKSVLRPKSLKERLFHAIKTAAIPKEIFVSTDGERESELKGKLLYENLCMGGDDHKIVITKEISEVIDGNFTEEEKKAVRRVLPPAVNIYLHASKS